VCCVCLQLWGTIDHVEAPGPSELVLFEASSTAQQAAAADQLTWMGQQVGHTRKEQRWFCCRGWQGWVAPGRQGTKQAQRKPGMNLCTGKS
jgi:hypothetical protein